MNIEKATSLHKSIKKNLTKLFMSKRQKYFIRCMEQLIFSVSASDIPQVTTLPITDVVNSIGACMGRKPRSLKKNISNLETLQPQA
jgi:hypothetical protein